ncbi:HAD hydrolase family protein [Candidatus Babeliales bacterium]|nr:HAD hydrolase family protein [Candidatus Babeliales bacterium]
MNISNDFEWFKACLKNEQLINKLKNIKLIVTDIDGCLTDANVYPNEGSEETKGFSVQDGFAVVKAIQSGLKISLLTGKTGQILEKRASDINIEKSLCYFGFGENKTKALEQILEQTHLTKNEILFFGDDVLDIELKNKVSLFACPSNAIFYIKPEADLILPKSGGHGAFRLLLDLVLFVQKKHFKQNLIENAIKK